MKKKIAITVLIVFGLLLAAGLLFMSRLDCLFGSVSITNKTPDSAIVELRGIDISTSSEGKLSKIKQYSIGDKQFYFASTGDKTQYTIKTNLRVHTEIESPDFVEIYFYGLVLDNTPVNNNFQITSYVETDGLWLEIQVTSKWRGDKAVKISKKYHLEAGTVLAIEIDE